ncbi:MAG: hypothetical protein H0T42_08555, partial [Deltaproteobacteria bacterium]|nr:hypothetical protein [Deltaproteobacteria bacterium]
MFDRFVSRLRAFLGESLANSLRRRLRAAAPSPISELREGLHCRIAGTVRVHDHTTLTAPLSGRACVAYLLEVIETLGGASGDHLLIYDKQSVPFVLSDGGHNAVVDPTHSQILLALTEQVTVRSEFLDDPRQRAVLERYRPGGASYMNTRRMRYREWVVEPGARVTLA